MSSLRFAVYVAPPIPFESPDPAYEAGVWSPISCTLVYTEQEAVLVDTPITTQQTQELIAWIEKVAPGRALSYIYVTHGHGDHFFGIPVLLQRFPEATAVATPATIKHMEQQIEDGVFNTMWNAYFPGQIFTPFTLAKPLPETLQFKLQDRWIFQAVECGHSDTYDSTILWVPDLKLAVCGDVVYGQVHQMFFEANTKAKRDEWTRAVEKVEALNPVYVVPGHRQAEEMDGVWHLETTKNYIADFGKILAGDPQDPKEVFDAVIEMYPERFNPATVRISSMGVFLVSKEERI
ncbi:hypothetical protein FOPG_18698 [Fusarium oxysporum f. sp. conglutinans race 2 54008]|uniref:Metallo-beta-lactamase domain-containing protein n=3 Tax=Fusarium oxysporum f. sp. conglutinans TaxID=100902 RepID=A0A8H6LLS1_FUSOX|nr:hypothetical protein FOXB_16191 [Fusarium oxysporum f. sp. conglutinans Fo5176]EXL65065.1 hypothetical protein FOPG_18698 [Fusarium oxysporum f. sp. conglutinans race 2 54008]KAF6524824.1 hypothetical protein HZS61_010619 [Fusarium oxysporum f. sp. conglutinans]KAG6996516.1 hypothetical protein FocnCong_v016210 [Fusarium oxysporum f. sp. conglutinans]